MNDSVGHAIEARAGRVSDRGPTAAFAGTNVGSMTHFQSCSLRGVKRVIVGRDY
jgi:hypothetical protein